MKTIRIVLMALGLLVVLGQAALCEQVWLEQQITNDHTWPTSGVRVWGDQIYWNDRRSGKGEIYTWDASGGERLLITGTESLAVWSANDESLVITKYVNSQYDLYLWDETNGMQPISTGPGNQWYADSYGQTVVWEDYRSGDSRVYIWDAVNGERRITSAESHQVSPQIWGDTVVWEDRRGGQPGIYTWNPTEGERFIGYGVSPAIHEGKVVAWTLAWYTEQGSFIQGDLWQWTPDAGYQWLAKHNKISWLQIYQPQLWGDLIAWGVAGQYGPALSVQAWYPGYGIMSIAQNPSPSAYAGATASVYGNKVAWTAGNNVYLSSLLVPEPSGLLALAGCACALCAGVVRRRRSGGR